MWGFLYIFLSSVSGYPNDVAHWGIIHYINFLADQLLLADGHQGKLQVVW
jgi:hypothetical protein